MNGSFKASLAEFIGTFTLIFIGAGAGAIASTAGIGQLGVAWAHGLALMVIVYCWGSISGAHVNPAVTFGVLLAGRMGFVRTLLYWIAQCLGAVAAAYLLQYLLTPGAGVGPGQTIGSLTPTGGNVGDAIKVILLEGVLTFFIVVAVFASGVQNRNGNIAGVAIGLVLTMDIILGGGLTGASMNPARTLGPAVVMKNMDYLWMYVVGPLAGGGLGALVYDRLFTSPE